jgi:hypothetical protein
MIPLQVVGCEHNANDDLHERSEHKTGFFVSQVNCVGHNVVD